MTIRNVIVGTARHEPATGRPHGLKRDPYVRPYTQFERGGVYRFRSAEVALRPFRVA